MLSTSLWGRELKDPRGKASNPKGLSTSLWGRELKEMLPVSSVSSALSTSLWGRELKDFTGEKYQYRVPGRPPCEVVNWKQQFRCNEFHLRLSTSLWGRELKVLSSGFLAHVAASTSLWGRELKVWYRRCSNMASTVDLLVRSWIERLPDKPVRQHKIVDLLVRSWIERSTAACWCGRRSSTSLWGRELKVYAYILHAFRKSVDLLVRSWIESVYGGYGLGQWTVDLLVRSWIESNFQQQKFVGCTSTSLWGRELKAWNMRFKCFMWSRPPCEVVNWKEKMTDSDVMVYLVDLLVRSWIERAVAVCTPFSGQVDLLVRSWIERVDKLLGNEKVTSRPPCEVVNWKENIYTGKDGWWSRPPCEVVNWKTAYSGLSGPSVPVDLLVRSWIERPINVE